MSKNLVVRIFLNTNMGKRHDGLKLLAEEHKVKLDKLNPGEHVVFLNRALDKVQIYSAGGVLSYYRSGRGRLNIGMVEQIPLAFTGAGRIDWDKADRLALEKQLEKEDSKKVTPRLLRAGT
jgi:hypothetical protein